MTRYTYKTQKTQNTSITIAFPSTCTVSRDDESIELPFEDWKTHKQTQYYNSFNIKGMKSCKNLMKLWVLSVC